jgi:prevent-host-death family protein
LLRESWSRVAACNTAGNRLRFRQEKEEHRMKIVTIDEAQTQLPALLDAVEATGEPVLIYRQGTPVADIVPHRTRSRLAPHPVMQQIRLDYDPTEPLTADEWPEQSR